MIYKHCKLIQEDGCVLFYRYSRVLKGYEIVGLLISTEVKAKIAFARVWKYFINEVVKEDDIYCSILPGIQNDLFKNYTSYYDTIDGITIYKVDNYIKVTNKERIKQLES